VATRQLANALETIEVAASSTPSARSLLELWEPVRNDRAGLADLTWLGVAAEDEDPLIRACAELVRSARDQGGTMARSRGSMTRGARLVLRGIPALRARARRTQRVAAIAGERVYADGEVIGTEGELGDEMHVVLDGSVRVVRSDGETIAHRGTGDIVGEMAVITKTPRVASLVAEGDVRTLCIGQREFEGMVRERPDIAFAVMRVLAQRLGDLTNEPAAST
jgi:hypothetical protein